MLTLGTQAPEINLKDVVGGKTVSLETFKDKKALLVMFICRHCPYVKHVQNEIANIGRDFQDRDIGIVAISANDPEAYPEDAADSLSEQAQELGFVFPYCFDETQEVAKAYTAACTPDFFLFDKQSFSSNKQRKLVYRGQLDDSKPDGNIPVGGKDLRAAIGAVLSDKPVNGDQKPSIGCGIKWKTGNEPNYCNVSL